MQLVLAQFAYTLTTWSKDTGPTYSSEVTTHSKHGVGRIILAEVTSNHLYKVKNTQLKV